MKIIVSTSDRYIHLIPIFCYLFRKNWGPDEVEIVGYKEPENLPEGFTFYSMGKQGPVNEWSTDLRKYFELQDDWFIWIFEDTLIRSIDHDKMFQAYAMMNNHVGRIGLTKDIINRDHVKDFGLVWAKPGTMYRQSTQASIWNKDFLLNYLTDGLSPWAFELQPTNDDWNICGSIDPPLKSNEGVRKSNIYDLDLNGFSDEEIKHIKTLL